MHLEPPLALTGPVRLDALTVQDWALEQRLSQDPEVVRWTYYPAGLDEAGARERIEAALERAASGISRRYAIRDERGEPLGTCGLGRLQTVPEVFYAVLPEHRRRGVATAAVTTLTQWALARVPVVALETVVGNAGSEGVARSAGFEVESIVAGEHRGRQVRLKRWLKRTERAPGTTEV